MQSSEDWPRAGLIGWRPMSERLAVDEPAGLFEFLASRLAGWHRNTLRERLRAGCVRVNGETVTRRDHALLAGDEVEVVRREEGQSENPCHVGARQSKLLGQLFN